MQRPAPLPKRKWSIRSRLIATVLAIGLAIGLGAIGGQWALGSIQPKTQNITTQITKDFNVRRHFDGQSWGTFWDYCGVTLTADHVANVMVHSGGGFTQKTVNRSGGLIDAAWYGRGWRCDPPQNPVVGTPVYLLGYPSGTDVPSLRRGHIYLDRGRSGSDGYEKRTWIVVMDDEPGTVLGEPVVGGMSGGIVVDMSLTPVGLLATQNSPADLDGDGRDEHSADIVGLGDIYDVFFRDF